MADIARKVGLGRSTVSMALRNHPEIALATRRRVQKAAEELGYLPDPLLSLLMSNLHDASDRPRDAVLAVIGETEADWNWRQRPIFQTVWSGMEAQRSGAATASRSFASANKDCRPPGSFRSCSAAASSAPSSPQIPLRAERVHRLGRPSLRDPQLVGVLPVDSAPRLLGHVP